MKRWTRNCVKSSTQTFYAIYQACTAYAKQKRGVFQSFGTPLMRVSLWRSNTYFPFTLQGAKSQRPETCVDSSLTWDGGPYDSPFPGLRLSSNLTTSILQHAAHPSKNNNKIPRYLNFVNDSYETWLRVRTDT